MEKQIKVEFFFEKEVTSKNINRSGFKVILSVSFVIEHGLQTHEG